MWLVPAAARRAAAGTSHMRASMPAPCGTTSSSAISAGLATLPSVRLKPMAKSSRSAGLAIITACVVPS